MELPSGHVVLYIYYLLKCGSALRKKQRKDSAPYIMSINSGFNSQPIRCLKPPNETPSKVKFSGC